MNMNGFNVEELLEKYPDVKQYLEHDVLGLLEAMDIFSATIFKATYQKKKWKVVLTLKGSTKEDVEAKVKAKTLKEGQRIGNARYNKKSKKWEVVIKEKDIGGLDMTKLTTSAKFAKENFYLNYYNQWEMPLYLLAPENDEFIRKSYSGGRVECLYRNKIPVQGKIYYFDFTSHFPAEGAKHDLPYGDPKWMPDSWRPLDTSSQSWNKQTRKVFSNFFGFLEVQVRTLDKDRLPLHAVKKNGKLLFPIVENWTTTWLFSEEMRRGLELEQYEYKIVKALGFKRGPLLKKAFEDAIDRKAEARLKDEPALAETWKIAANSLYGVFGQRTKDMETIKPYPKGCKLALKHTEDLVNEAEQGDYHICRVIDDIPIKDHNVGVAAAITSYARIRLFDLMDGVRQVGGNVLYCDSDSMICDVDLFNVPHLQKDFMFDLQYKPDGTPDVAKLGDALGSLKNECYDKMKKLVKKGKIPQWVMDHHLKEENYSIFFDECITYQAKFYGLRKTLVNGYKVEICKCKGYKVDKEDSSSKYGRALNYELLRNPTDKGGKKNTLWEHVIKNNQFQFRAPKSSFVDEQNFGGVSYQTVKKEFRLAYTKGSVDKDGFIKPFVI